MGQKIRETSEQVPFAPPQAERGHWVEGSGIWGSSRGWVVIPGGAGSRTTMK